MVLRPGHGRDGFCREHRSRLLLIGLLLALCLVWAGLSVDHAWQLTRLREAYLPELEAQARREPQNGNLLSLLGARLSLAGHYRAAASNLQAALAAGDTDPQVWLTLAGAEAAAGESRLAMGVLDVGARQNIRAAIQAKQRVLRLGTRATPIDVAYAISPHAADPLLSSRGSGSFLNGLVEWWGRRHPESSGFATRANWARDQPDNPQVQRLWGEALTWDGSFSQAERVLKHALKIAPSSLLIHRDLAVLYTQKGLEGLAMEEYRRCLQLQPGWMPAQQALTRLQSRGPIPHFVDEARTAGLDYRWTIQGKHPYNILQTIGNGCAFLDYDNDGSLDILLVGPRLGLFKGDGHGHFQDVTQEMGLDRLSGHFLGCAVGDYDNDGYEDLYISAFRGGILLHNEGGHHFKYVTAASGIVSQPWGSSCAFADIDNDGRLDLYIGNYVYFGPEVQPQLCDFHGHPGPCGPAYYAAERGVLYHNEGNGRFRDVTHQWRADHVSGKALGVAFADYDGSGRQSLALANDELPGDLLWNQGSHFENAGVSAGLAYDSEGRVHAGMGIDWGDYDNDGKLDLAVSTFQHEPTTIYHNQGSVFSEESGALGIRDRTMQSLGFGLKWLDYDNDGWLDLVTANGHVNEGIAEVDDTASYRQSSQLFHNEQGRTLQEVSSRAGEGFQRKIVGRGLAVGDYDNDGRLDLLIVDSEGRPLLLHNETLGAGHWLSLRLVGTRSNKDAIGAMVTVRAGGLVQRRRCSTDGSYLSASDRRVHVGLGASRTADTITIQWPHGSSTILHHVLSGQVLVIHEPTH